MTDSDSAAADSRVSDSDSAAADSRVSDTVRSLTDLKDDPANPQACQTSLVVPLEGRPDTYVISTGRALSVLHWTDQHHTVTDFTEVETDRPSNRFNDGKCDPTGNLWAGECTAQHALCV